GLRLPAGDEVQVFHIVQEALANVHRHANATRARVTIDQAGDRYEICVEDDGLGMATDTSGDDRTRSEHYGIAIMRERAQRLGGELTLRSVAGAGTAVRLNFPAVHLER
ncbi:MAG TPA: ATP-binding protein, partial [Casimicrobiaceae bacterium]